MLDPDQMAEVFARLRATNPDIAPPKAKGGRTAFRSVVSCMLSAQSLDRDTAAAADALFALADTPEGILALADEQITSAIRPCGLYNVKARNLRKMCRRLIEEHGCRVPEDRKGLMSLPGVGRKCADLVLHFTFGQPVIAVDTHVHRVCNRTGLAQGRTEAQTAASLDGRIPEAYRMPGHLLLLDHGKRICRARAPRCGDCVLVDLCEAGPIP
ncbi:endonuclease III domain-containing protein [Jannaschia formosa]|uniref:endonuclease III domain-containing protein n=1 Tax=Jannaschia formosa TaxID=2259592 RepID=UPI000E1BB713|nr:endonuclease III [Jannaschia formosa]TFL17291.1 endonuclease III [Jannaschia formosa]